MHKVTKIIMIAIGGLSTIMGIAASSQKYPAEGVIAFVATGSFLFALVIATLLACLILNWLVKAVF